MNLRERNVAALSGKVFDALVVGGGINGAVSAAALSARGASVALIEGRDFAGFTSQHSSNLIWGGIKYMESYEFPLVAELCRSRNELMRSFPSTVKEIRFLMTVRAGSGRHPLMLWAGAWIYWLIGRGFTRTPAYLRARGVAAREPVVDVSGCRAGIEYSDAYLHDNDARFVFNFIRNALDHGCVAANYVASEGASRDSDGCWRVAARDALSGASIPVRSRILINAAGAFVDRHNALCGVRTRHRHVFSKGVHLLVPRLTRGDRVLAFFADDGRLFFAIPMANRTCIGTTDTRVPDPETRVSDEDREFVLANVNARLRLPAPLTRADVIAERCGVRPLVIRGEAEPESDFLQLSRRHVVETSADSSHISIFGGKLTDCVNVGNEICERVSALGVSLSDPDRRWYGDPGEAERAAYERRAASLGLDAMEAEDTGESLMTRLWRRYGARAVEMLDAIEADRDLTRPAVEGTGLRRCELAYLARSEMIVKLEDLLRRRSKLELILERGSLASSRGLRAACETLFGAAAGDRYDEYFSPPEVGSRGAGRAARGRAGTPDDRTACPPHRFEEPSP